MKNYSYLYYGSTYPDDWQTNGSGYTEMQVNLLRLACAAGGQESCDRLADWEAEMDALRQEEERRWGGVFIPKTWLYVAAAVAAGVVLARVMR
jgi:hypothetical protein